MTVDLKEVRSNFRGDGITTCDLAWPAFSPGVLIGEHSLRGGLKEVGGEGWA